MEKREHVVDSPVAAFERFQQILGSSLKVSKAELEQRIAEDNAARTADRIQRGYKKRGPKSK